MLLNGLLNQIFRTPAVSDDRRFASPLPTFRESPEPDTIQKLTLTTSKFSTFDALREDGRDRLAAHRSATAFVEQLSFYNDGWGMFASPALTQFYHDVGCGPNWRGYFIRELAKSNLGLYSGRTTATGFLDRPYQDVRLVVTGCAVCHFGRAAGMDIAGLGNKNIDPYALGKWIGAAESIATKWNTPQSQAATTAQARSLAMSERLCTTGLSNPGQGSVPVAMVIRWFFEQQGMPVPSSMTPGAVKVPSLWGYEKKLEVGIFCDGMGDGRNAAWAAMVELAAGNDVNNIRQQLAFIAHSEHVLGELLPPAYPGAINHELVQSGRALFESHCADCHGNHIRDQYGFPVFEAPLHFPLEQIGTDEDRLEIVTPLAVELIGKSPLRDVVRIHPNYRRGYFAPRLDGIWARFPYLHNGSVPNLESLLAPAKLRPKVFDLADAGEANRFDYQKVGLTVPDKYSVSWNRLQQRSAGGVREVYDVSTLGRSNQGHEFGCDLTHQSKLQLIEYLKTL